MIKLNCHACGRSIRNTFSYICYCTNDDCNNDISIRVDLGSEAFISNGILHNFISVEINSSKYSYSIYKKMLFVIVDNQNYIFDNATISIKIDNFKINVDRIINEVNRLIKLDILK